MADRKDFDDFVVARWKPLLRSAYLLTGDWGLAEDLVQAALARCWLRWHRIEGPPEAYVRRTLATVYASWWRRRWRGERPSERLPERVGDDDHAAVDSRDEVWRLLASLPRRQRAVIVLRYYEDLSEREIANVLGCRVGTVKSQASRALATLRRASSAASTGAMR